MKPFNTRLPEEIIEKIQAVAWYQRSTIQDVAGEAFWEYFDSNQERTKKALEAYRKHEKTKGG